MEQIYIGTKIIAAEPMNEIEFLSMKGQLKIPEEIKNRENREGYQVRYEDGYVSWSPKETFERAYREVTVQEKAMIFLTFPDKGKPKDEAPNEMGMVREAMQAEKWPATLL